MWGLTLIAFTVLVYMSVYRIPLGLNSWEAARKGMGGGYVGGGLALVLMGLLGRIGTSILLVVAILISAVMGLDKSLSEIATLMYKKSRIAQQKIGGFIFYEEESAHPDPAKALSDGPNAVPLKYMKALLEQLVALDRVTKKNGFLENSFQP